MLAWAWYPIEDSILALHKSISIGAQYVTPGSSSFIGGVVQKKKTAKLRHLILLSRVTY
jgi:hypothetical protein